MGWKNVKEHYRIGHIVQVTDKGICIGSPYIHDLIIIGMDGMIIKADDSRVNEDLRRYMTEFRADQNKLKELVQSPDAFVGPGKAVFTYSGGDIVEKRCDEFGWPNVTRDGCMMYENSFFTDRSKAVQRAKENAAQEIKWWLRRIEEIKKDMATAEDQLAIGRVNSAKLDKEN